nr:hypothetical protein [Tanacetum cinerariifolium]
MMTRSAGWPAVASRKGGTGGGAGRGGGGKGREVNDGDDGVLDFSTIIAQQLQNLLPTIGLYYKEFLACNAKEYDGKGGAIVYTCWMEKMESVQDISGCRDSQKVKYTAGLCVGKALTLWNSQIYTRGREATIGKSIERYVYRLAPQIQGVVAAMELRTIQKAMLIAGTLTDEALRNGSIKKNPEKRGNRREPSNDRNERDDNKMTRTGNAFATTANSVRREYTKEARQDLNIMTGIEPSDLGFSYEIKIASRKLVEIDKVIKGCKLEIEGHVFDINFVLFGSESFDMIIGMDWLSNHSAEIICHEKVVRIPLPSSEVLRVLGERPK